MKYSQRLKCVEVDYTVINRVITFKGYLYMFAITVRYADFKLRPSILMEMTMIRLDFREYEVKDQGSQTLIDKIFISCDYLRTV